MAGLNAAQQVIPQKKKKMHHSAIAFVVLVFAGGEKRDILCSRSQKLSSPTTKL